MLRGYQAAEVMSRRQGRRIGAREGGQTSCVIRINFMKMAMRGATGPMAGGAKATIRSRIKTLAIVLLLSGTIFAATGCHDDPYYYGRRGVRTGYYASYGGPAPYYGYDPYPYGYGYGYGSGIGIGVSSYRSHPGYYRRPYYRRGYDRPGYYRRYDRDRRRNWERRRRGDDDRSWERRARGDRSRAIRRSTAPAQEQDSGAPVEPQPE